MTIHRVANLSAALMVAVNLIVWLPHVRGQLPSEDATKSSSGNKQLDESSSDRKIPIEFRLSDQAGQEIERHVVALGDILVNKQILVKSKIYGTQDNHYKLKSAIPSCGCVLVEAKQTKFDKNTPCEISLSLKMGVKEDRNVSRVIRCEFIRSNDTDGKDNQPQFADLVMTYSAVNPVSFGREVIHIEIDRSSADPIRVPLDLHADFRDQLLEVVSAYPAAIKVIETKDPGVRHLLIPRSEKIKGGDCFAIEIVSEKCEPKSLGQITVFFKDKAQLRTIPRLIYLSSTNETKKVEATFKVHVPNAETRRAIVGWNVLVDEIRIDPSMVSVESTEKCMYIFKVFLDASPSNKLLSITGSPILNEAKIDDNSYFLLNGRVSAQE